MALRQVAATTHEIIDQYEDVSMNKPGSSDKGMLLTVLAYSC